MPQLRVARAARFEYGGRAIAILNIGDMDNKPNEVPERIGDVVKACIKPARPARFGRFHRLAINHARAWRCRTPSQFPRLHRERVVDAHESAIAAEAVEICLHRRERRELPRDLPPLTAGGQHVENNHAQRYTARLSPG